MVQIIHSEGQIKTSEGMVFSESQVLNVERGSTASAKILMGFTLLFFLWAMIGFGATLFTFVQGRVPEAIGTLVGSLVVLGIAQLLANWRAKKYWVWFSLKGGQQLRYNVSESNANSVYYSLRSNIENNKKVTV